MAQSYQISKERIAELLAKTRAAKGLPPQQPSFTRTTGTDNSTGTPAINENDPSHRISTDRFGNSITLNEKQSAFVNLAASGKSCILLGAAGTGKTTCMKETVTALIQSGLVQETEFTGHKYLPSKGPGIVVVSFTRRAVNNIRKNMPNDLKAHCVTIHKLLEFRPEYYDVVDEATGKVKKTRRFEPFRNGGNPIPGRIRTVIVEESSMVSCEQVNQMRAALPSDVQWIYLGDIQQLPPVFGSAILGYKMLELPTVELTEVYRQALESPIIRLAHRILSGVPIKPEELQEWKQDGALTLHPWKKKVNSDIGTLTAAKFFTAALDQGEYDPEEDMILIPFNKAFGTDEINKHIANHLARKYDRVTYEVIAGFNKHYFSVGDKVLYDKEDAVITGIKKNPSYFGKSTLTESTTLDYWGHDPEYAAKNKETQETEEHLDFMLEAAADASDEDKVNICSHLITVKVLETEYEIELTKAAEVNAMILSYTLTVHKSQGSEWRKVFLVLHNSHATMLQRELLYTAVTRAKEELYVICEPESFVKGIASQRIKGNTLAEKAEFFMGKIEANGEGELK